jgi:hypothetical protein
MYSAFGPPLTWGMQIVILVGTISLWIFAYKRLVPLEVPEKPSQVVPQTIEKLSANDLKIPRI